MEKWVHKGEFIVDRSIPYLVALLLVIILVHLFGKEVYMRYEGWFNFIDAVIVGVFVVDLVFKYIRVRNMHMFFKRYWLDVIAVFPFYLVLRVVEEAFLVFRVSEELSEGQKILHTGLELERGKVVKGIELEREAGKIVSEAEKFGKFSRTRFLLRALRPVVRMAPRLVKIMPYFERAAGKPRVAEKKTQKKPG